MTLFQFVGTNLPRIDERMNLGSKDQHPPRTTRNDAFVRFMEFFFRQLAIPILVVTILAPLPDIAQHIVEAISVWLLLAYWMSLSSRVAAVPRNGV